MIRPDVVTDGLHLAKIALLLLCLGLPAYSRQTSVEVQPRLASERVESPETSESERAQRWLSIGSRASDPRQAIENYEKALAVFRRVHDRSREANTLHNMGSSYVSLGEYVKAIGFYEQALLIARDVGSRVGEATTLNHLGEAHGYLSHYASAIGFFEQSLAIWRELGDLVCEGAALNNLGTAHEYLSEYAKAIAFFEQALVIRRYASDRMGEGRSLSSLGEVYLSLTHYESAIELLEQALEIEREVGDRRTEAITVNNLGAAYAGLSRYERAIDFYEQSLAIRREVGDRRGEGPTLNNLGDAYRSLSQYAKAIAFFEQALQIERELSDRSGEGATLSNLGLAYQSLSQYERAVEFYEQSLAIRREVGDRAGAKATLNNLGTAFRGLQQYEKAIDFYEQALVISRDLDQRASEGTTLNNLGVAYASMRQWVKAIGIYEQALAIAREVGDRAGEGDALNNLGVASHALSQHAKAIGLFERAVAIMREVGDRASEAQGLSNLMDPLVSEQRLRLAVLFGKQAVNAHQRIRQDLVGLDQKTRLTYLESSENTYRKLAGLLLAQNRIAEAHQVLNLLKEVEFFDFVRRDSSQVSSRDGRLDLTAIEADWDRRYNEIAGRLTEIGHERGELVALQTRTDEQDQRLASLERDLTLAGEAFQRFLAVLDTQAYQQKISKEKLDQVEDSEALMETLRELGPNTVAIYTLVTEDRLRLIVITPDVMKTAEAAIKRVDLNTKIVAFRQSLENRRGDPGPLARELYTLILGPIEKDLAGARAETLLWSLDGALRYLPVAALHDGEHYLVERFGNVVFTPASNANLKDAPAARWRALALGVSKAHPGFRALPGVQRELEGIIHDEATGRRAVLPGAIRLDEAFTRDSMLAGLRQRYRVVHIASHFSFKPGNETDSFLLLGDGGHMTLADVGSLENPFGGVDLLTLSACDTANGGTGESGKEVEGFAVLAQRKGAKAVIATLWPVADASTAELMQAFYRTRESTPNMTKVEALQQAQLALLRGTTYGHPFYWAPFILIGNSR